MSASQTKTTFTGGARKTTSSWPCPPLLFLLFWPWPRLFFAVVSVFSAVATAMVWFFHCGHSHCLCFLATGHRWCFCSFGWLNHSKVELLAASGTKHINKIAENNCQNLKHLILARAGLSKTGFFKLAPDHRLKHVTCSVPSNLQHFNPGPPSGEETVPRTEFLGVLDNTSLVYVPNHWPAILLHGTGQGI